MLQSELALSAERAVELSEKPMLLQSELAIRCLEEELPRLKLSSALALKAAQETEELEALHRVLQAEGIPGLRAAVKALELRKLHQVLQEEGLPALRARIHAKKAAAKAKGRESSRHSKRRTRS